MPDDTKSLAEGAIATWAAGDKALVAGALDRLGEVYGIDLTAPFGKLPKKQRDLLPARARSATARRRRRPTQEGARRPSARAIPSARASRACSRTCAAASTTARGRDREALEPLRGLRQCPDCEGERLRPESRAVRVKGQTIAEYVSLPISDALRAFESFQFTERENLVAGRLLREICDRLRFLDDVGVGYLTLGRSAATLSGGEGQRIRLATQIGANLTGVLYVLDEPSIGLHQRDNRRLLATLCRLRDQGNSVIVVEHDEETIRTADYLIDLGPRAGEHGGKLIFQGRPEKLIDGSVDGVEASLTGAYLRGERRVVEPRTRRAATRGAIEIVGATHNNLKHVNVSFPLGLFIAVTGVSGSGKSTLVNEILYKKLAKELYRALDEPGAHDAHRRPRADRQGDPDRSVADRPHAAIEPGHLHRPVHVPARALRDAAGRAGARLQAGPLLVQRQGRPLRGVPGRRRHRHRDALPAQRLRDVRGVQGPALQPRDAGDPVSRPLDRRHAAADGRPGAAAGRELPVDRHQAEDAAAGRPRLPRAGAVGDDAVRRRGAARQAGPELSRRGTGRTLYILDEPTTGLHFDDTQNLLDVLHQLVEQGNTAVVIEHNLDVIRSADWVIDLGPEGGAQGGKVVAQGPPETIEGVRASHTGRFLARTPRRPRPKRQAGTEPERGARATALMR